jgi:putative Holliday junction resolvase
MKYMALDYGLKRVGIAVTDPEGRMVFPRRTLIRRSRAAFFRELALALEEERPDVLVLGLPLRRDGSESLTTRQTRNFADSLKRRASLPVYWMEEELSSCEAERSLRESGRDVRKDRALIDQEAAVRILESFLSQPETARKPACFHPQPTP